MSEVSDLPALDEGEILRILSDVEPVVHLRRTAQKSRKRFWLCEYFRRMGKSTRHKAIVSRVTSGRVFVWLPEYLSEFPLHGADAAVFKEGQTITVTLKDSDPIRRRLRLLAA